MKLESFPVLTVTVPKFGLRTFTKPAWDKFAGEAGAYVAESSCGQFEAQAEPIPGGWRLWVVPVNDPENSLCVEDVCAS